VAALGTTGALIGGEYARVWARGSAPLPTETSDVLGAAEEAVAETVEVAVPGYKTGSTRGTRCSNCSGLLADLRLHAAVDVLIRTAAGSGPIRKRQRGATDHIHHFVPGIILAFLSGGISWSRADQDIDPLARAAVRRRRGAHARRVALLLELDDVYWTERGSSACRSRSGALAMLSSVALALRVLRRGRARGARRDASPHGGGRMDQSGGV
jgi:hypothetical protein